MSPAERELLAAVKDIVHRHMFLDGRPSEEIERLRAAVTAYETHLWTVTCGQCCEVEAQCRCPEEGP